MEIKLVSGRTLRCAAFIICAMLALCAPSAEGQIAARPFRWPSDSSVGSLGQDYAHKDRGSTGKYHTGLDVSGTNVVAAASGVVEKIFRCRYADCRYVQGDQTSDNHIMQNVVIIRHTFADGTTVWTLYAHLGSIASGLIEGQAVSPGTPLGMTGVDCHRCPRRNPTDPPERLNHVHFEAKARPLLHNPYYYGGTTPTDGPNDRCTEQSHCYWGYTPDDPQLFGYYDPIDLLHNTVDVAEAPIQATTAVNIRMGPSQGYTILTQASAGQEFLTQARVDGATSGCQRGWYQVERRDGQFIPAQVGGSVPEGWMCADYTAPLSVKAVLTSPAPGSTLPGSTVTFHWNAGTGVAEYFLEVGTGVGSNNLYGGSQGTSLSRPVSGIPTNGSVIYVRLWSRFASGWQGNDYTYRAAAASDVSPPGGVQVTAPTSGQGVTGVFAFRGTAQDNSGTIQRMEFYVDSDGAPACTDSAPKASGSVFQCSWDTRAKGNGPHSVRARAYDAAGNATYSGPVSFLVSNTNGSTVIFQDNMENGSGLWFGQAPWALTTATAYSGSRSWTDSPGGSYSNNSNVSLWSPSLDLSRVRSVTLSFRHRYNLESGYDFANVWITPDNGATYTRIASFTGATSPWIQTTLDLSAFAGRPSVRVVFQVITDSSVVSDGWYIDDVNVSGRF